MGLHLSKICERAGFKWAQYIVIKHAGAVSQKKETAPKVILGTRHAAFADRGDYCASLSLISFSFLFMLFASIYSYRKKTSHMTANMPQVIKSCMAV